MEAPSSERYLVILAKRCKMLHATCHMHATELAMSRARATALPVISKPLNEFQIEHKLLKVKGHIETEVIAKGMRTKSI